MVERPPLNIFNLLLSLFLMAFISFLPSTTTTPHHTPTTKTKTKTKTKNKMKKNISKDENTPPPSSPWDQFKSILSCKNTTISSQVNDPSSSSSSSSSKYVRLSSTCGSSICSFRDVVHGNTRVVDHASSSSDGGSGPHRGARKGASEGPVVRSSTRGGGMQLRKLSGCYECRAIDAEPASRRYPRPRTLCPCADCGEVFTKPESLEHHQALRHAVSELGPEDSGRNIVEIIFKSSWQSKQASPGGITYTIERILKVHNRQRVAQRFEDYRESVKSRALLPRKHARCAADGNELLRFHCSSLSCPLGSDSSTSLCLSSSNSSSNSSNCCEVCTVIRYGFARASGAGRGIRTTASSGRAHECGPRTEEKRRAMLVCRVIAGRVRREGEEEEEGAMFDSVVAEMEELEELFVVNPRAILPCFVVIYKVLH